MADILIKGMEMPETCRKCDLHSYTRTMAGATMAYCRRLRHQYGFTVDVDLYMDEGRHPECPLVEVKPHGRCIDADSLKQTIISCINDAEKEYPKDDFEFVKMDYELCLYHIGQAPTVLEATE